MRYLKKGAESVRLSLHGNECARALSAALKPAGWTCVRAACQVDARSRPSGRRSIETGCPELMRSRRTRPPAPGRAASGERCTGGKLGRVLHGPARHWAIAARFASFYRWLGRLGSPLPSPLLPEAYLLRAGRRRLLFAPTWPNGSFWRYNGGCDLPSQ